MAIPYEAGEPLTCQQIRELDILAIEHVGIPGLVLMENAGRAVAEFVYQILVNPPHTPVVVLCGPGNNGGDGYVVARMLRNAGVPASVVLAAARDRVRGDAAANLRIYERLEAPLLDAGKGGIDERVREAIATSAVVVDALLGTGSSGPPRGVIADLIRLANDSSADRVAVDIPSGLDGDSGSLSEPCFRADATVTFVAPKVGFAAAGAGEMLGRIVVADIGVPRELIPGRK